MKYVIKKLIKVMVLIIYIFAIEFEKKISFKN